ncbi:TRMT1-like protein [Anneissia japonica]|uniref:TRMT1-like protein n=1 Tax=Anneissia japonica TaxID=1529436 RepID=UPI0014254F1C|nr:TRMT1-like protein [Anneissia japonica]XP_033102090.1 TRMT1-like protein [Anneissia japonica]XP_033102092.1 TRMT1-like protein [Anneissia japonica]
MMRVVEENGLKFRVSEDHQTPEKSDVFFNPKIRINRELVLCGLSVYLDEHKEYAPKPARCLDAFAASGALGLQWQKHLNHQKHITLNDNKPAAVENMHFNCQENGIHVYTSDKFSRKPSKDDENLSETPKEPRREDENLTRGSDGVEIVCQDSNILLLQRAFDFIHLDPFGTAVHYLESAFRNTPNKGVVSITSTDLASVYGRCPRMTKRHYSANVIRSEYYRELAARLILGAVAKAAARCNKGIEVLVSVAYEHFILVMVRVVRGPQHADLSVEKVQQVIHCLICGDRCFLQGNHTVESDYYGKLKCNCKQTSPGKTAVFLGPVWSGSIFKAGFIKKMLHCAERLKLSPKIIELLKTLHSEAVCSDIVDYEMHKHNSLSETHIQKVSSTLKSAPADVSVNPSTANEFGKSRQCTHQDDSNCSKVLTSKRTCVDVSAPAKRVCKDDSHETQVPFPSFYFNVHLHTAKGKDALKMKKVIQLLKQNGFQASRTHFDPVAVRTNASLQEFLKILTSNSLPTSTIDNV